ncbi:lamin tail domain-containing protein [uncultured Roseivirga sp.]|uniref:lamin tail domain-containing protein n=1 Tax=uncultured Roseivirga sp. TaxID=543088 RepID=UPI000D79032A|nr:lamin tail domain-containing protein [uncultured Roseivirga sp.]PWL30858.1 MAG: hypothetical protein DCO95_05100 [Roseivirga sp. XM-24bin3]
MRNTFLLIFFLCTQYLAGQVSSFPYTQGFEAAFTTGNNVEFITNWTANEVATTNRIYQGTDARTGSSSINIIPISSFSGEILISLDLTGINNPKLTFYAYSKQNGSGTSTRPVLVSFATSIDGGNNFLDNVAIGDETTFPNNNSTSYTEYEYELPVNSSGESNVVVRLFAERGDGAGSAAELVMDDFSIVEQVLPLALNSVVANNANTVVVTFNQEVDQASAETTNNYAIDNGITISSANRTASNEVTLTTSTMPNNNYELTVNGVSNTGSTSSAVNLKESFNYIEPLSIAGITVQNKNTLLVDFNLNLEEVAAETVGNYTVDNAIGNPTTATRSITNNNQVTLTFASDFGDNSFELTVNNVTDESTLASAVNLTDNFSYLPLSLEDLTVTSATTIELDFNQDLETTSAENESNYTINFGRGNPSSAVQSGVDASIVTLTVGQAFVNNTYEISIDNVSNISGNAIASNLTANAQFEQATSPRQIVINELFADPSGSNEPNPLVLPNGSSEEFVELFNTTSEAIDLTGFELSGGTIGDFVLNGGSYVILTSASNVATYQSFGDVVAVSSWNSQANGGEQLVLLDNLGNQVDSLTYDLSWYQDEDKADGGWTIEQINPELVCSDNNNWIASSSAQGGTPGTQNSVYDNSPDITGPNITAVNINTDSEIVVVFDEIIDEGSLAGANFSLSNGVSVSNSNLNLPYGRSITLTLNPTMTSGTIYTLTITGLTDCAGNSIDNNSIDFLFDDEAPVLHRLVYKTPDQIDLIFDEEVRETLAETESNFSINSGIGNPDRATLNSEVRNRITLELASQLTEGSVYSLTYQNLTDTLGNTIALSTENFGFQNQLDTIIVISSQLLDIYFDKDLDETSAEIVANYVADDGLGNPVTAAVDGSNAKLVHLVFGSEFPENSTTEIQFENIQDASLNYLQALNTDFTYDTDDPDVDSVVVVDENTLRIYFDEILDETSAETINNYTANNSIGTPAQAILQADKTSVILNFSVDFEQEVENRLTLTAIEDLSGNAISANRNYDFTYDRLPPRLVGVELLSPTVLAVQFSEEVVQEIAENVNNYSVNNGIGRPLQAVRTEKNTSIVELTFADLGNFAVNTITISNVTDLFENDLIVNLTATFSSQLPEFGRFIVTSDTSLQIQFTKELTQASAEEIENYGFDSGVGPFSLAQSQADQSIVNILLTVRLTEGENYRMVVDNLEDLDGNILEPVTYDFTYSDLINQITLVNANTLEIDFEVELDEMLAETTANYELDGAIGNPLTAVLNGTDPSLVTLFFDQALTESETYELVVANLLDIYGDVVPRSRNTIDYDVTAPTITAVNSTYNNEIEVVFNEPLDRATATSLNHYSLNNGAGQPSAIELSTDATSATLIFNNSLIDATNYTLTVDRVEDLQGKAINAASFDFTFESPVVPSFRDLVISEVYFDNKLSAGIPNYEFIEIYNQSADAIELRDFAITDKRDTAYLTSFVLQANAYITLSNQGGRFEFKDYGNAMGLSNFPSLSNTGETLILLDRNQNTLDSLLYSKAHYNNETKQNGGFTIELINPDKPCFDVTNYAASTNADGGTPGTQNSVYDISPDVTAPLLSSVEVISNSQLRLLFSEAIDVSTLLIANFSTSGTETVSAVTVNDAFGTDITLTLSSEFALGTSQTLSVSNVADCSGNVLNTTANFVSGAIPEANELLITEIMASPAPSNGLPEREYVEIYNNSSEILSLNGLKLTDNNSTTTLSEYDLAPGEYLILASSSATASLQAYGNVLVVNAFPTLSSDDIVTLSTPSNTIIFSVDFDNSFFQDDAKDNGGYSIEMINLNPGCYDNSNWTASNDSDGGTPGAQNSVYDDSADTTAPQLLSLAVNTQRQLEVTFNESMALGTLIPANFSLSSGLTISSVDIQDKFGTSLLLNLNSDFSKGILHSVTLSNITDCSGNLLPDTTLEFSLGDTPQANEILITEIMASPAPSNGLPEREYFEIYNNSNEILDMSQLVIKDGSAAFPLPSFNLPPEDYLIVTTTNGASELSAYGNAVGVNSFPTLTIKDTVTLENADDELVFEVAYDRSFYSDDNKDDGGFSIEMINLNLACYDDANWTATTSSVGGTPGAQNSVFDNSPDLTAPSIQSFTVISSTVLEIEFSESMNIATLVANNFTFSGSLSISSITQTAAFGKKIRITLSSAFTSGELYNLAISNLSDCAGNALPEETLEFSRGATPSPGELVITEIMAAPTPAQGLPEVEYLEVLNVSSQILDLNGVILADATTSTVLTSFVIEPGEYVILAPSSTANQLSSFGKVLPVNNWPSLNNSGDRSALFTPNSLEIHSVNYTDEWYRSDLRVNGGYSLEIIDPDYPCLEASNWIASDNADGGTPGTINSADGDNPDLSGPAVLQAIAVTNAIIELSFNERLEPSTVGVNNFSADNGLTFISAQLDETKRKVTLVTASDLVQNTLYTITVNNLTDCTGNLIQSSGKSAILIIAGTAEAKDIIVNEILFNPVSGGDRFVEFYNNSSKYINLKGWKIAGQTNTRVITEDNLFIHPNSYFVITNDAANIKTQYPSAVESAFIEISSMPSLPSDEGTVFIYNLSNLEIDKFEYSEDYHSSLLDDPDGVSLERILFSAESNDSNNWFSASSTEGGATPGYANSQSRDPDSQPGAIRIDPATFAPDAAGAANFTTVNYSFDDPGNTLNIRIVDAEGRVVKRVTQNSVVGTEGFFTWDGSTEDGGKAKVGYYMIIMEVISSEGRISYIREKVAIASRF